MTSAGTSTCPTVEPTGVACDQGALKDLVPGATYAVTELQVPPGYLAPTPTTFTGSLTGATTSVPISDSAAVGNYTTGSGAQNCTLCLLGPSGTALSAFGGSQITWAGPATVNSTSAAAAQASGLSTLFGGALFDAGGIRLTGLSALHGTGPTAGTVADPFSWFTWPTSTASPTSLVVLGPTNTSRTATPGVYSSIVVSGAGSLTLEPGVYIITGSVSVTALASLTGTGVTIDLECAQWPTPCRAGGQGASLLVSLGARLILNGGAVGPGDGFVLLGDRVSSNTLGVSGGSMASLTGNVYGPGTNLQTFAGSQLTVRQGEVVASQAAASVGSSIVVSEGSS